MSTKNYSNFVRPSSSNVGKPTNTLGHILLSGEEARKIYVSEVKHVKNLLIYDNDEIDKITKTDNSYKRRLTDKEISDKELFLSAQNNDTVTLKEALDSHPDKINKLDDYGWSLLMIACQANSLEAVKELLKRGCNTSVRDKAGNSAQSLIIKNKNFILADILLNNIKKENEIKAKLKYLSNNNCNKNEDFFCDMCNIRVRNREYHLSSTIHNINLSKGKKIPTYYKIPESNKGYQLMLKVGWDKESGLGPDGAGKKYPIKTVQKKDRKGLGHSKKLLKADTKDEHEQHRGRRQQIRDREASRKIEVNFRRQFY